MHISMILKYKLKRRESGCDSIAVPITAAFLSFICLVAGKQGTMSKIQQTIHIRMAPDMQMHKRRVQDHHMSSILVKPFLHKLEFTIIEKLQCLGAKTRPGYRTTVIKVQKSEKYLIFRQLQPCTLVNNYFV
ncbi:hypothetical protein WN944_019604 [Citrus x changshan-huyou]|uniref:Uncharacterized protein n=1 Tax=Citrus x changshan-huyou TaxID=2935761 RepID=A0AAP0M1Y4_9ROSI